MKNVHQIREISTLSFNERVLQEAEDERNPLLERLKFLGIFSSNMDEFFKVRVASIHRRIELGKRGFQGILEVLNDKARGLDERFRAAYDRITRELADKGIRIVTEMDIVASGDGMETWVKDYFRANILPGLVPLICYKTQPFPQLTDGALYLAVVMRGKKKRYAILEVPPEVPRFVELPNGNIMYVDDVIRLNLNELFYIFEYEEIGAYEFKVSRDAQLDIDNDFTEGYIRKMERVLKQRKGGRPTRLVYDAAMPQGFRRMLQKELNIDEDDTLIPGGRYHNMKDLMQFPAKREDLMFPRLPALPHPVLDFDVRPMMDTIRERDVLITYPYQSFGHVIRLLREAAIDPHVKSIKMTMYRSANHSQVVNALYNAARNGKKIFVSIELQARFDEQHNIHIAETLTEVGAHVVYGVPPLKVHSKLLLIERRTSLFAGLSTGNFNEATGRLYVDSILLTSDKRMTAEVAEVFSYLETAAMMRAVTAPRFKHLLVSPFNSRRQLMALLQREKEKGEAGYVLLKTNHLTDPKIIKKLYDLADAGVQMDFIVRTTYAMKPHPKIRAISILDRYLEHQRIYIFGTGKDRRVFLGSADLMERNLDWRVEVAFPLLNEQLAEHVHDLMQIQIADTAKARILDDTQSNPYVGDNADGLRAQWATRAHFESLLAENANAVDAAAT
ncbi:MAG: polyphosphate kinase 1 [Candidatus Hydrogenedentes bacterium]|nr:polyphosphate kinase 1 [Candidatus Hydrogenedentota bacterium]